VIQHFLDLNIPFDPTHVWEDVSQAIQLVHSTHLLHQEIAAELPLYLNKQPDLGNIETNNR
jgi:hypothetical protein